jgi:hypothetical protein
VFPLSTKQKRLPHDLEKKQHGERSFLSEDTEMVTQREIPIHLISSFNLSSCCQQNRNHFHTTSRACIVWGRESILSTKIDHISQILTHIISSFQLSSSCQQHRDHSPVTLSASTVRGCTSNLKSSLNFQATHSLTPHLELRLELQLIGVQIPLLPELHHKQFAVLSSNPEVNQTTSNLIHESNLISSFNVNNPLC